MKSFVKIIVPKKIIVLLKKIRERHRLLCISFFSKTSFLANLYYSFHKAFSSEHVAVLKGRKLYYDSLKNVSTTSVLLRRNIHRIEKGLIMRPRRLVFAENYIIETVKCFALATESTTFCEAEKKWAIDVLNSYFEIVKKTKTINLAYEIYSQINKEINLQNLVDLFPNNENKYSPYVKSNLPNANISFDTLKSLFIQRRSIRWYEDKTVDSNLIKKAVNIAALAPSACNRQPFKFIFCNEKEKVISIAESAGGIRGYAENLPAIIVLTGDLSAYPFERDRHIIYIDSSLAAMQFMLALETLGLSSCVINWPESKNNYAKIRKIIDLEETQQIIMLISVGYADKQGYIPYSQKKQNELIFKEIK